MTDTTSRYALPLLAAGQAQKETTHNEALAALDMVVQPRIVAIGLNAPPSAPQPGDCWIVGSNPTGAWTGHADALAGWTEGGWRFVAPVEGLSAWAGSAVGSARYVDGAWQTGRLAGTALLLFGTQVVGAQQPAIDNPAGGTAIDASARAAIDAILGTLRTHGLIAT